VVHGTQSALARMRVRNRGTIIQVGSALAYRAIPLQATYCAAKFAVRGFTDSVRCELLAEHSAVRVTMVQLPGLNTTQFGWVRTTLGRRPRPVAPFYQPEVAARAIVWAAAHPRRRELWVGANTVAVIIANKLMPGVADRYLARTNIEAQQDQTPIAVDRPDYLYEPLAGDRGSHGPYDHDAKSRSVQLTATEHRASLWAAVGLAAGAAITASRRRRSGVAVGAWAFTSRSPPRAAGITARSSWIPMLTTSKRPSTRPTPDRGRTLRGFVSRGLEAVAGRR
jgi:hypothetical protein